MAGPDPAAAPAVRAGTVVPLRHPPGMALSTEARARFLAEPHVAALAVTAGPDRGPLMSLAEHGDQVVVRARPERWLSADLG
jgi:hypothetical protein